MDPSHENSIEVRVAREAIRLYVTQRAIYRIEPEKIPAVLQRPAACFVSIHLPDGSLRGCMGTLEAHWPTCFNEIVENAVAACSRDPRFEPLGPDEVPQMSLSVDILSEPEALFDLSTLDPARFGLIVSDGRYRKGVLLPNLPGIDTIEQQVNLAMKKAGIPPDEPSIRYWRFTTTRYH